jgi:hypothetical protein
MREAGGLSKRTIRIQKPEDGSQNPESGIQKL